MNTLRSLGAGLERHRRPGRRRGLAGRGVCSCPGRPLRAARSTIKVPCAVHPCRLARRKHDSGVHLLHDRRTRDKSSPRAGSVRTWGRRCSRLLPGSRRRRVPLKAPPGPPPRGRSRPWPPRPSAADGRDRQSDELDVGLRKASPYNRRCFSWNRSTSSSIGPRSISPRVSPPILETSSAGISTTTSCAWPNSACRFRLPNGDLLPAESQLFDSAGRLPRQLPKVRSSRLGSPANCGLRTQRCRRRISHRR